MGFKKIFILILGIFGIVLSSIFIFREIYSHLPNRKNMMVFFQISRGDAFYLRTSHGKEIIWDGGDDKSFLKKLSKYRPFWDRHLDYWIITHTDSDHYYGGLEVLKQFEIENIILTGVAKDDEKYKEIFSLAKEKNINIIIANSSTDFMVDGVFIDTLFPVEYIYGSSTKNGNNYSLVQRISTEKKSILLTGDIEKETEKKLLELGIDLSSDILKVAHHGSKSSSSQNFVLSVNPEQAIMTTGTENKFGHPHKQVLDIYKELDIPVVNSRNGDIVIEF